MLNVQLELEKEVKYSNWGYAYVNGFVVIHMFRLGTIATGGIINSPGNLSFTKRSLVGWMSGS
jgi:hypothetical protein